MRAVRTFTVRTPLPAGLEPLRDLAVNLRWSWDERTQALFASIDPRRWPRNAAGHDPIALLAEVGAARLQALAADEGFVAEVQRAAADLQGYLSRPGWAQPGSALRRVAYFSPEFGISEALPQYSGGLGVLAGDHLKAASDLGIPLIGVGLFYRYGYFRQFLDADGWQDEQYPHLDPHGMALTLVDGVRVEVELGDADLIAQVWKAQVGRVNLYLLDTDIEENDADERLVTDRLYGGGPEHRIRQEILLGMGGLRALRAIGEETQVLHTNEGHAGFLTLERVRELVTESGLSLAEAVEATRAATIFTTHTPVSAGIDRFPRELMERYFKRWAAACGVSIDELMALGHEEGEGPEAPFNMAVLGLRMSGRANAVSKLHARVTQSMFASLWPQLSEEEVPVAPVTNGVHFPTWVAPEVAQLFRDSIGEGWPSAAQEDWGRVERLDDASVWAARRAGRARLVETARRRHRPPGPPPRLDPEALTIGFARRFAPYKRATLLLSQPERLRALLLNPQCPVQLVFGGKAHPADDAGKQLIRAIVHFSRDPEVRDRFVFVEDYDIGVARAFYQGADVWLNTPRRPMEACGTSGEKAALNGTLNLSILDGWWDEMYESTEMGRSNGWAIDSAEYEPDEARRDEHEANSLFVLLEHEVVPLFYDRPAPDAPPPGWCAKVRDAWASLGPKVSAARMVREYTEGLYEPTAQRVDRLSADGYGQARSLSEWKRRVVASWDQVQVLEVASEDSALDLGGERQVEARVALGDLAPSDVVVQAVHGTVGAGAELSPEGAPMALTHSGEQDGLHLYRGSITGARSGRYGIGIRVVPGHPDLAHPLELGVATWAEPSDP
ncbi:MAG TPA: alpha-glucan family phosphorylase [Acidimicrobiales bacterium]|nr:alpha-glucan family phosphorylase [Acidimicrobiales bacterium]